MRIEDLNCGHLDGSTRHNADLVLFFDSRRTMSDGGCYAKLRRQFPQAIILGCSTGGQIRGDQISDDACAIAALQFDATTVRLAKAPVANAEASREAGRTIGEALAGDGLAGIFLLSDGLNVNGSELVAGIASAVGRAIPVTGGLAGDGDRFETTLVAADGPPRERLVGAVGFYGSRIRIGSGSAGGWSVFGPRRRITHARGNVLYKLDGKPALDLYELYLGEEDARALPGSALLFPLRIRDPYHPEHEVVRTVLSVDRDARSMTFAGDVPEGWTAQLMRGNFDDLARGAGEAASQALATGHAPDSDGLAILVSCIGRRMLMGQNTLDEVEATGAVLGARMHRLGFYAYGEISPHGASGTCELHNQTMTITTLHEIAA